jgi:hypothetical protein
VEIRWRRECQREAAAREAERRLFSFLSYVVDRISSDILGQYPLPMEHVPAHWFSGLMVGVMVLSTVALIYSVFQLVMMT